jgi:hypothetical protein
MIPTDLFLCTLTVLCVIGVRHFRRAGNRIGYWTMLIVTILVAAFAAFLVVVTIIFLLGPPLVW